MLQQRDEKGFSYLYDNYAGALYGIINSIVPDRETSHDLLQDVFVNIWKKIESYDPAKGRLFTWMLKVARNAAIDKLRSKSHQAFLKNQPLTERVDIAVGPRTDDVGLKKVLTRLKNEQRILIDLSYFQGFTHDEIARMLGIPLGTVKTRIRSALTLLKTMLQ